jgi:hypothetical protein
MMHFVVIFGLLTFNFVTNGAGFSILSGMEPQCDYDHNDSKLTCSNFISLNYLNFSQSKLRFKSVFILPDINLELQLNSDLDLTGLKLEHDARIILKNFKSIDPLFNPFKPIEFSANNNNNTESFFTTEFVDSEWDFGDKIDCQLLNDNENEDYVFSNLNLNQLIVRDCRFSLRNSTCPIIFKNSTIKKWTFIGLNPIEFASIKTEIQNYTHINQLLNINVEKLEVLFGYDSFMTVLDNKNLLNEFLFAKIKELVLNTIYLSKINGTSLEMFPDLEAIRIVNYNLKNLFKNGIEWMKSLNLNRFLINLILT